MVISFLSKCLNMIELPLVSDLYFELNRSANEASTLFFEKKHLGDLKFLKIDNDFS